MLPTRVAAWLPALALGLSTAAGATTPGARHVQARLVAEVESIRAGEPFWVGLHLKMEPEWHTYWKNPGDAGLPTRMAWTLPQGFRAGPLEWPHPERFGQDPVVSYGYADEVLLPVRIEAPAGLAAPSVTLAGRADWLECREACLPGRAELSVTLPVRPEAPRPSAAVAALFQDARARMPQVVRGADPVLSDAGRALFLTFRPAPEWGAVRDAYFYPEAKETLDHAAPQRLTRTGAALRLELTPAVNAPRPLTSLAGVLVARPVAGPTRALRVEALVARSGTDKAAGGRRPPTKEEER